MIALPPALSGDMIGDGVFVRINTPDTQAKARKNRAFFVLYVIPNCNLGYLVIDTIAGDDILQGAALHVAKGCFRVFVPEDSLDVLNIAAIVPDGRR